MVIGIGCHHLKGDAVSFNLAFLRRGKRIQYGDFFESRHYVEEHND